VRDGHIPFLQEEILDQSVFPLRCDSCFADTENIHEEELDGETPARNKGGRRAPGTVGLYGTEACSVVSF
jgi:hypothetical protein